MSFPGAAKPNRIWLPAVAAVVVLAAVVVVAWLVLHGTPGSSSTAPAVTGETVKRVLLDGAELTAMLDQPLKKTVGSPVYGDLDEMDDSATPSDCVGVANTAPQSVYRSADVQSYARETLVDAATGEPGFNPLSAKVMFVEEAVVALPSAADADALFAKFSEQWKRCDGQAVNAAPGSPDADSAPHLAGSEMHIVDVRVTDTVLAASVVLDKDARAPDTRAVGVQGNCLIEVLIAFTGAQNGTGSGDPKTSSTDAVRAMMDKVSKLS